MAKTLFVCALIAVIVLGVFAPALGNGFVGYDDGDYVAGNPHVRSGLSRENLIWALTASHANNWHPLTWISHQADSTLFGLEPRGHHLTSVVLHAINTALLFWWLNSVTGRLMPSAFVALGFGLHPLRVESVAWVAERKDVLSTLFWMLTLIAYTMWVRKRGAALYALTAAFLAAGLLAKQMLVTLPAALLILDWWPLRREEPVRRLVMEKLPLLALSAIFSAVAITVQSATGAASSLDRLPLGPRLENALVSSVGYLGKIAWPMDLSVFYPFPLGGIPAWKVAGATVALITISVIALQQREKRPWLAAGWAWYILTLLPVIGIVQVGMQSMGDRYTYVPMIGLLLAIVWEASAWPRLGPAAGGLVLAAWSALTIRQIPVWKDGVTLFTQALRADSENFVAHDNLGVELDRRGQFEEALHHYRETLRIKPGDRNGESNFALASFAKGERLAAAGKQDEALAVFREGLRYRPRHALARVHVGRILSAKQQPAEALREFDTAIEIEPSLAAAHMGRGVVLAQSNRPTEARAAFEKTVEIEPNHVEARFDLGIVLAVLGRTAEARSHFEAAIRLNPGFQPAKEALAQIGAQVSR